MYIKTKRELKSVLRERRMLSAEISKKINEWVMSSYGIKDFLAIRDKHMPFLNEKLCCAFLARQIPSVCVEDVSFFIGAAKLGLEPVWMSFVNDNFSSANSEKLNRVKIPWSKVTEKGKLTIRYENISGVTIPSIESSILSQIPTICGENLPEFHGKLRRKVFGEMELPLDISAFWKECLEKAGRKPEFVYESTNGKGCKIILNGDSSKLDSRNVRPPSSWYYPLYFSCFVDGSAVLLETYENPDGQVPEARKLFLQTMEMVKKNTGVYPLILEIPPLTLEMRCLNKSIIESDDREWLSELNSKISLEKFGEDGHLCQFFREIGEKILYYRK